MSDTAESNRLLVWTDAPLTGLIAELLGRMAELQVVAVGGPRHDAVAALADRFDCRLDDDLRKMLIDHRPSQMLIGSPVGPMAEVLRSARAAGVTVVALEPPFDDRDPPAECDFTKPPAPLTIAPALRAAPAWGAAADPAEALGRVRSAAVTALAPPALGSLYARLWDAFDTLVHLMGLPVSVDATLVGPLTDPPASLRRLTGTITAHLRFDSASAVVHASDQAATFTRTLTALGDTAQLALTDAGYTLHQPTGELIDDTTIDHPPDAVGDIAAQWRDTLRDGAAPPSEDAVHILACCTAALLSCRTGQQESIERQLQIRR